MTSTCTGVKLHYSTQKKHTDASSKKQYSFVWAGLSRKKRTDALLKKWYSFSWDSLHHKKGALTLYQRNSIYSAGPISILIAAKEFP